MASSEKGDNQHGDVQITLVEYAEGMHGFDTEKLSDRSRELIKQTLEFMKRKLGRLIPI